MKTKEQIEKEIESQKEYIKNTFDETNKQISKCIISTLEWVKKEENK